MATKATTEQEAVEPNKTELRAQWEAFEFRVPAEGRVRVENISYGEESGDHVYVVSVESGIPFDCTCPAWKYHNPADGCKHMVACENQPAVLMAASAVAEAKVATDGGEPGTTEVGGCVCCGGFAVGDDEFCSPKCRERGEPDDTPL